MTKTALFYYKHQHG